MRKLSAALLFVCLASFSLNAQDPAAKPDPWKSLRFLLGTWEAKTSGGSAGAQSIGTYSFDLKLKDHVMARHSSAASCKAPEDFDCQHSDLLFLYSEGWSIKAIYFDNEGHIIHYSVTTPSPNTAVFVSDSSEAGPLFRLVYERKEDVLSGKFQMEMPGQTEFKSYLEWSGGKR